ncbi:MAG: sel1 repeat family protein, partial [Kiritimatiellaceae bacterium]|nr:sel1 repeat family protein [Kiritimatiellaceae bacterium]
MKKWIVVLILIFVETVCAELTILKTEFNRAPLNIVEEEANKGVAEAQAELAFRYYAGHQVAKNQTASFEWMSKAAGKKHLGALLALFQMYVEGIGIAVDPQKAEDVFISAIIVGTGDARIQPMFDRWVENKKNSGGNVQEFMKKCADSGYGPAYSAVYYPVAMEFYQKGQYEQALPLLVELSRHGDSMGTFYLAQMYAKGEGSLPQDAVEAFALYQQAATNGNGLAQVELAAMYSAGLVVEPDAEMVRFWLNEAAEQGQREAQYKLAELEFAAAVAAEDSIQLPNEVGQRVKKEFEQRMDRAVFWYKAAAEQSHPDALYMLGRLYASGDHVLQDFSKAVHYYQAAVAQGHNEALFYLGLMHHAGIGVEKDVPAAVSFYQQAATQGVTGALYYLGNGYRSGIGVQQN